MNTNNGKNILIGNGHKGRDKDGHEIVVLGDSIGVVKKQDSSQDQTFHRYFKPQKIDQQQNDNKRKIQKDRETKHQLRDRF